MTQDNFPTPGFQPAGSTPTPGPQMVAVRLPDSRPVVSYLLIGVCVVVYIAQQLTRAWWGVDIPFVLGVKANDLIVQGEVWRLFTPMFLHDPTSIVHIVFNMYALYNFGPGLERHYGHWRFLALFLIGGLAGNVASFAFSPQLSLGSSTAIFGLLGAEGIFLYQHRHLFGNRAQRALTNIILIAVVNLIIGLSPGIDNWGHMGGLVGGTLFAWLGGPRLKVEGLLPNLTLVDSREARQAFVAAGLIGGLFGLLAIFLIIWRASA